MRTRDARRAPQLSRPRPTGTGGGVAIVDAEPDARTGARRCRASAALGLRLPPGLEFQARFRRGPFGLLLDVWLGTRPRRWDECGCGAVASAAAAAAAIIIFIVFESGSRARAFE